MKLGRNILVRFGLISEKVEEPDLFDVRLVRIGVRERRCTARAGVFKTWSQRPAA